LEKSKPVMTAARFEQCRNQYSSPWQKLFQAESKEIKREAGEWLERAGGDTRMKLGSKQLWTLDSGVTKLPAA
jgi:hypothetical protein